MAEKVGQHLTKCMDYHELKRVIIPIDFTISSRYLENVQKVQSSTL